MTLSEEKGKTDESSTRENGKVERNITSFDQLFGAMFGLTKDRSKDESSSASSNGVIKTPVSTLDMDDTSRDFGAWHIILNMTIVIRPENESEFVQLLRKLETFANEREEMLNFSINQNPEERNVFFVMERYRSKVDMMEYQKQDEYRLFMRNIQPFLKESIGIYICKEKDGKISHNYYPFGPAGEGGRDDMPVRVITKS